ncbi:HEPN domain-containing protein [Tardisphaera miroshnichenkoae]
MRACSQLPFLLLKDGPSFGGRHLFKPLHDSLVLDYPEYSRWISAAKRSLDSARSDPDSSWACFKAEQSAQLAIKALLHLLGKAAWGHGLLRLAHETGINGYDLQCLQFLSRLYIPTRYPDALPEGEPSEYFSEEDKRKAIQCANAIITWVEEVEQSLARQEKSARGSDRGREGLCSRAFSKTGKVFCNRLR